MRARAILVATAIAVSAATPYVHAQPEPVAKDGKLTISMTITPGDYLKPASRNYLLPGYEEGLSGNRVQMFLRCFMEQNQLFGQEESARREKWKVLPLKEYPVNATKSYAGTLISRDMYDAARMTQAEWQILYFLRRDGYETLLPDVQKMRDLARVIKTRVRGEIAAGDAPGAIHSLKTMFGLARTLESHPTLIGDLVGIAIATEGLEAVEELIQQPGSPNLFWSLADLPRPFISLRLGIEGERIMPSHAFEELKSPTQIVADAAILKLVDELDKVVAIENLNESKKRPGQQGFKAGILLRAASSEEVKNARERIVGLGMNAAAVQTWSPLRVTVIDDILLYERARDEVGKMMNLPYFQVRAGLEREANQAKADAVKRPILEFVPAVARVKQAQARLEQRIAYIQMIEAIRLHAFKNGGTLPATLEEISLPLPMDPVTGKSFEYSVAKGVATLHGANPGTDAVTNRYYLIRLDPR